MRRFRIAAFVAILLLVGAAGLVAYNLGVSAGAADAAIAAGASVIYAPAAISPFGIIIGGFFLILLIGFIVKLIAGPRRGMGRHAWGPGGYGPGGWDHDTVPERFRPMLESWHTEAHDGSRPPSGRPGMPPPGGRPTPPPPAQPTS